MAGFLDSPPFEVTVRCKILDIIPSDDHTIDYVRLQPLGFDQPFRAMVGRVYDYMYKSEGNILNVSLGVNSSTIKETNERMRKVTNLEGEVIRNSFFRAVGQFAGSNGQDAFVQSSFMVVACADEDFNETSTQKIGRWVEVEGDFIASWSEEDVVDEVHQLESGKLASFFDSFSPYRVTTNCKIHAIASSDGFIEKSVSHQPLGYERALLAKIESNSHYTHASESKTARVKLVVNRPSIKATDERETKITDSFGGPANSKEVRAIGQIIGYSGEDIIVQSVFIFAAKSCKDFNENSMHRIGQWIAVEGQFYASWDERDLHP